MLVGIALGILIVCLLFGIPVAFSFMAATIFMVFMQGYDPTFLLPYGYSKLNSMTLLAIPLFIVTGNLMNNGNIGDKLVDFVDAFVGRIKGGLAVVTTVTCAIFGSITGSAFATASCIGSIMKPKLLEGGYSRGFIGALLANSSILGLLIPPSGIMIIYAWLGRQSVLATFLAIVAPGILMTILLSLVSLFLLRKDKNVKVMDKMPLNDVAVMAAKRGVKAFPALLLPIIILGGIYGGFMTPTEAAAVGSVYAIPVGFLIYKGLNWKNFKETLIESAETTGVIMVMFFSVMILSRIYVMEDLPGKIMNILMSISDNKLVILLMLNIFMIIFGMIMDDVSACSLCTPILLPIAMEIGVDPVHFAAILAVNLGTGNITPPTAPLLYVGGSMAGASLDEMLKPTMMFILFAWIPTLIVTTYFPSFAMWLPNLVLGQ